MIMKNLLNVLIVPVFLFCSFQKESGLAQKGYLKAGNAVQKGDRIMYLFFKADKDPSGREKIVLQDSKILEGRLKLLPSFDRDEMQKGDLIITVQEAGGKEISRQLVKNPLQPELEVYEKEGVSRQKASLPDAEFSVRFAYSENIRSVKIEKVAEDGIQLLFTQKL
ncbi:hypothetical protein CRN76_16225 [Chryseobacterium indologenes]|uniref:Uncharacterized protein n=2 Tax=Chryseobacterium group TaxID=2782232 RepID=A0AAD0YXJ2_CHRID|nr:hypothetical protein CRN76_16225 [Chryseobacterium indologenes]AYY84410.1 hypothetical protein EGX91_07570 [Chryseobacterium indologenes]AZB18631.1 hypothetical protein EG352_12995 [Chryseobacterium indologenes]HAO27136.1 hypothetical protein [Chryseobacterium indologenes]